VSWENLAINATLLTKEKANNMDNYTKEKREKEWLSRMRNSGKMKTPVLLALVGATLLIYYFSGLLRDYLL